MRILILCLSLSLSSTSFATTYLKGVILKGSQFQALDIATLYHKGTKEPFPRKYYDTSGVFIENLEYDDLGHTQNNKKFDLKKYAEILANGKVKLMNYNSGSGQYDFKLKLSPTTIHAEPEYRKINGKIKIDNKDYYFFVGFYTSNQNKLYNSSRNNKITLQLDNAKKDEETMIITAQENIPVQIELD